MIPRLLTLSLVAILFPFLLAAQTRSDSAKRSIDSISASLIGPDRFSVGLALTFSHVRHNGPLSSLGIGLRWKDGSLAIPQQDRNDFYFVPSIGITTLHPIIPRFRLLSSLEYVPISSCFEKLVPWKSVPVTSTDTRTVNVSAGFYTVQLDTKWIQANLDGLVDILIRNDRKTRVGLFGGAGLIWQLSATHTNSVNYVEGFQADSLFLAQGLDLPLHDSIIVDDQSIEGLTPFVTMLHGGAYLSIVHEHLELMNTFGFEHSLGSLLEEGTWDIGSILMSRIRILVRL